MWSTNATSAAINVNPTITTNYTVSYTVNGCASQPATAAVTVNPIPTLNVADTTICGGLSVQLTGNGSPSSGTYLWSGNGLSAPNNQQSQITVSPSSTTSYSVSYTANGCTANDNVAVTVIQNPIAAVNNATICSGGSATLVASPAGGIYSWSNGTTIIGTGQTITVNPTVTSTYTVSVSVGGCVPTSATSTVTVNPIPTVTAAPGATICNGQTTTIGTSVSAPGGTYAWTPAGSSSSLTITPTLSNTTAQQTFTYSVIYTLNGCPSLPSSSTVTVNPKPTVSVNNIVICSGSSGTIEANPNLSGGVFNWSTGLSGTIDSLLTISHLANPVNQVTLYSYNSWYILNGCSSDTVTSTITVNPIPTLTSPNSANICSGGTLNSPLTSDVSSSNFNWVALDNTNVTGESLVVQSSATINNTLINLNTSQENVFYSVTPTFGNCAGIPQTIMVVVNPNPFINTINEIICSGGSFDTIPNPTTQGNIIPSNTLYTWSATTNNSVTGEANNSIASTNIFGGPLYNTLPSNATVLYTVTPIAGPCIGSNFNVNITITPTPEIADNSISICSGNYPTIPTNSSDIIPSTTLYSWIISTDNSSITGQSAQSNSVSSFNNQILVNTTSSAQTIIYEITPQSGPCTGQPFFLNVTVNPGPNLSNSMYEICSNTSLSSLNLGSPGDIIPNGTQYTWTVANNTSVTGEASNNTPSSTFNTGLLLNTTNVDQTVIYNITPIGPTNLQPQCNGVPFQLNVVVHPTPVFPNVTLPNICSGTSFTFDPSTNPPSGSIFNTNTIFNWTVTPNTNVSGYSDYSGTNNSNITQILTNNTDVVQTIVYNVTAIDNVSSCSSTVFTLTINVYPTPTIQNQSTSVCTGTPFNVTPTSALPSQIVPNGISYSWINPVSNPIGVITGGAGQSNQPSISQVLTNNTTSDATLVYTVTPSLVVSSSLTCIGSDFTVSVIVRPIPTVTASATDPVICAGSSTTLNAQGNPSVNSSNIPGSYNWTPITQITGSSTSSTITAQPTFTTTYIVVYTLSGCPSQAVPVTVTVQNPPNISTFTALESTICVGGCTQLSANFTGNITVDYVIWSTGQTTTTAPHTITVCPTSTTQYSATAYLLDCAGAPSNITINVNPDPSILTQPLNDTTICVGGSYPLNVAVTNGAGTPQYQWYQNTNYSNIGGVIIPGATNSNYTPPSFNNSGDYFFYCVITYTPNGCGSISSNPSRIRVINDPQVQIIGENQNLCIGGSTTCLNAVVTGGIGITTYSWNPITGSNSVYCPPNSPVGSTNYSVGVVQTGIGCSSNSINSITVNIVPDPIVTITGITDACIGAIIPLSTTVTGGIGSVINYQWQSSNPIGSPFLPIINSNFYNYTTLSLLNDIGYSVSINQEGNGCNATDNHTIIIYDDPQLELISSEFSCLGDQTSITANIVGGTPGSTNSLTWYASNPTGAINPLVVQGPNNDLTYDYLSTGDTTIIVESVNSGFGCNLVTQSITIQGLAPAISSFEVNNPIQSFFDPTFNFINTSINSTEYNWDLGECNPLLSFSELYATPTFSYNPSSEDILDYTYGCPPGMYTVQLIATNQGYCPDTSIQIIKIEPDALLYVPNTFTPDEDNFNNLFYPVFSSKIEEDNGYVFRIYNRWGEIVFETKEAPFTPTFFNNTKGAWNGTYKGEKCQDGTYIWEIYYKEINEDERKRKIGHVNLIR